MTEVSIEAAALDDLENIVDHKLQMSGKPSAERFSDEFFETIDALERFPHLGAPDPDQFLAARGYRRISIEDFWCYYVVTDEGVRVRRILRKGRLHTSLP